jgi:hypothetical protein
MLTAAVVVFGALAIFMLRRRSQPHGAGSPGLWLAFRVPRGRWREGVLLRPYGVFWLIGVGVLTVSSRCEVWC